MTASRVLVGSAGWALPTQCAAEFEGSDSHLARYARRFDAVEINSSFYRSHRPQTYARWASTVPDNFSFSLKLPRSITHEKRLSDIEHELAQFSTESAELGNKRRCVLVQLPPSLAFDGAQAERFFATYRQHLDMFTVLEARHATWFESAADALFQQFSIARVMADPPVASDPMHCPRPYLRMHGTPRVYYSDYSEDALHTIADTIANATLDSPIWCIFDNTALGRAIPNALTLQRILSQRSQAP